MREEEFIKEITELGFFRRSRRGASSALDPDPNFCDYQCSCCGFTVSSNIEGTRGYNSPNNVSYNDMLIVRVRNHMMEEHEFELAVIRAAR